MSSFAELAARATAARDAQENKASIFVPATFQIEDDENGDPCLVFRMPMTIPAESIRVSTDKEVKNAAGEVVRKYDSALIVAKADMPDVTFAVQMADGTIRHHKALRKGMIHGQKVLNIGLDLIPVE